MSAPRMIGELADDLERDGVILVIARDVGQVRDVLRCNDTLAGRRVRQHHPPG
jgi:hypothetical protein